MLKENGGKKVKYKEPVQINDPTKKIIVVQAHSAGFEGANFAKISVNNDVIDFGPNSNDHYRGLHIAVINS